MRNANCAIAQFAQLAKLANYFAQRPPLSVAEHLASTIGKRLDERVGRANDKITKDCFPAYNRDAWLQKFKRFNTAISSSAAVERLFVVGSDILRSKRSSMTKENFKKFVLLRENEKCLKKSIFLHK